MSDQSRDNIRSVRWGCSRREKFSCNNELFYSLLFLLPHLKDRTSSHEVRVNWLGFQDLLGSTDIKRNVLGCRPKVKGGVKVTEG